MTLYVKNERCDHPGGGELVTKQAMGEQCDVNYILAQYQRTGVINHVNAQAADPQFLDLPPVMDLQDAMRAMDEAKASFAALPATVRDEFGNDPYRLLEAVQDPSQRGRLEELGVIAKKDEAPPAPPAAPPQADSKVGGGPGGAS